ncbi:MAG: gamma-glutamyl-gamma-aminobutyrate hydrolase family protein [Defluviitaleaceae bacterium]|nr:gamma-glutamyl-gamma-aminobutyrate hydrolase family protein [Defluviitaleaceae bacterium]
MSRPLIGVMPLWDNEKNSIWMLPGYLEGIIQAGGLPMILPLVEDGVLLEQICKTADGFLFTGGQDVFPGRYGEEKIPACEEVCVVRDVMEDYIFSRAVLEMNKPAFGICRGLQFFNVALGGTLYQDLPSQFKCSSPSVHQQAYSLPAHNILPEKGSPLRTLFEKDSLAVNSAHHQGILQLSDKLACMAKADDGLIEAVYMPDKKFVWAVQWHPECSLHDENSRKLFNSFVNACIT